MAPTPRPVALHLPADPHLLRVARVTASSMAATLPFTLHDIEDLRLAVDELAARAIEGCSPDAVLELEFVVDEAGDGLTVSGRVPGAGPLPPLHPVAAELLALSGVEHDAGTDGADRTFRFTKRAQVDVA